MRVDWTATARQVLGLGRHQKLPAWGLPAVRAHGVDFYLKAQGEPRYRQSGKPARRMEHRLFIICPCGTHVPAGRFSQHVWSRYHNREV